MMVTEFSAERISDTIRDVNHLPMEHTDHRELVRFENPEEARFRSLKDKIKTQAAKAPGEVRKRLRHIED